MKTLIIAALLTASMSANAITGNEFLTLNDDLQTGIVYGIQSLAVYESLACFPEGNTLGQNIKIVTAFLNKAPAVLHNEISLLAFAALSDAFPCANTQKTKF